MLRSTSTLLRTAARAARPNFAVAARPLSSSSALGDSVPAQGAWEKSCYFKIDFTIPETDSVYDAVQRFSAYDIGCLVVTNSDGKMSGIISERDYINKIALLGRTSKDTPISEVMTSSPLMTANMSATVEECMHKMLSKDIRHLPLLDPEGNCVGMLSVKDIVKELVAEKDKTINVLSDFALGKGGHFGSD
mmetsp:Transcript_27937/g.56007  ORF Transcript_27937/g.56007 Transcript_27937/m.56007 type:complete len:191 (+) Transcript_27937:140-712(+)